MSRKDDANDSTVDRRSVLKAVGVSAVGGIALSGSATARRRPFPEEVQRVKAEFEDPASARDALADHADPILDELTERGVLRTASVSAFPADDLLAPREYSDVAEGATVRGVDVDGEWDAEVVASTETDAHAVELVVQPNRARSYALVDPKDGGDMYRLSTSQDDDEVSVSDHCHYESQCLSYFQCDSGTSCQRQERHCCDDDGDGNEDNCNSWYNDGCCATSYCGA